MPWRSTNGAPVLDLNLYEETVLRDSRSAFARIRQAGAVVWLPKHRMYAMGRFDEVRDALRNDQVFRSGKGVAANSNLLGRDTTLFSDDDIHNTRRKILMRPLGAKALAGIQERIDEQAQELVVRLLRRESFDATGDFASHLPLAVVADLVGVARNGRALLRWAAATFDGLGPLNRRGLRAGRVAAGLLLYTHRLEAGSLRPGSWGASVFEARNRGEITTREARALVIDFVAPALDTTILASTHLLWTLARHPDAWHEIRADPDLVPTAVVENVRIASPIRGFTRTLAEEHSVDGVALPAGARVALLFGAANLDETRVPEPERFDLHRDGPSHVGWGDGPHTCVGIHLAKLEMQALLRAVAGRVGHIEVGAPTRLLNNTLQGIHRTTRDLEGGWLIRGSIPSRR